MLWMASALANPFVMNPVVTTLDNGLKVVIEEQRRVDVVAMMVRFEVGSRDEVDGERGVAHLFEHLAFEGSKNVPPDDFGKQIDEAGGYSNAGTGRDDTTYEVEVPSGALDLALFLESDRIAFLREGLTPDKVKNQQDVVVRERDEGYSRPHGRDSVALDLVSYPEGHPYRTSWLDVEADVRGFGVEVAGAFWEDHYRPSNATLVIVGNVDADEALERVKHWFSDVPDRGEAPARRAVPEGLTWPAQDRYLEAEVADYNLQVAWPGPPLDHPDYAALEVLGYVTSWGRGTRLDDHLLYDKQRAEDASFLYMSRALDSLLVFDVTSEKPKLKKMLRHVDAVVADLQERPPTEAELKRAKTGILSSWREELVIPYDRAVLLLDCNSYRGRPDCMEDWWDGIDAVTSADVQRVARTWFGDRRSTLSVVPAGRQGRGALPGATVLVVPE